MGTHPPEGGAPVTPRTRINAGDRLGRFEVIGFIGAGGMGHVYRARDPQLMREVAIKVLPAAFWSDPDRLRSFEREARAAATLNHPNILAVHDFGVFEGIAFIVTELLEGQTLRQRIGGRPLRPSVAVDYAIQIASGLAAGHDRGIVHRDIKPDNLFVNADGRIKILDFGLATTNDAAADDATAALTDDSGARAPVVGTPAYMSPEQVRGLRVDQRTDIFSVGVVLYEMLSGFGPFRRPTAGESVAAVLDDDPPALTGVTPELSRIVFHCLEKIPEQRFQSARDLIFDLRALPGEATSAPAEASRRTGSKDTTRIAVAGVVGVLIIAAIGYFVGYHPARSERAPGIHRVDRLTDLPGIEEFPSISPDGRSVAFTASVNGRRQVFQRLIATGTPVQITHDDADHQVPRWSSDGNSLLYFSPAGPNQIEGHLWRIPALGGSPQRLVASIGAADADRDERLVYFRLAKGGVELVTSTVEGSDARVIARFPPGYHLHPRWSPDGKWIAFQRGDGVRYDLFVIRRSGGAVRQLTHDRNMIRGLTWLPDSSGIVYGSSRASTLPYLPPLTLWRIRVDGGDPQQITPSDLWYEEPDIHSSGLLVATRMRMRFDIWTFPFGERGAGDARLAEQITRQTGQVLTPSAAPDGQHVVFLSDSGGHGNLWVTSNRDHELRQITFENDPTVSVGVPVWSPDGQSIAFVSSKGRSGFDFGIWLISPDGTNLRNVVKQGLGMAWSEDGRWLYYAQTAAGVLNKIPASGGTPVVVRREPTRNVIGLHETTLYYTVEHALLDGRPELEIRAATPENGPSRSIARIAASRVPSWQIVNPALSPNGEWLAMPLTDGFTTNIWALSTSTGKWRQVTDFGDRATFIARRVSWSPDGRAILAALGEGDADVVALNGLIE